MLIVGALIATVLGGCGAAKDAAVDRALEGSDVEINGLGKEIPSSFPADEVPLPSTGAELETAAAAAGIYTMRYAVTDPKAASDAYRDVLVADGFTIETEFDHLGGDGNNIGFIATNGAWSVTSSAFGPGTPDGLYEAVVVQPQT